MLNSKTYYRELLIRFIKDEVSPDEIRELYAFIAESTSAYDELKEDNEIKALLSSRSVALDKGYLDSEVERVKTKLLTFTAESSQTGLKQVKSVRRLKLYWAAASIIALLGLGIYFYIQNNKQQPSIVENAPKDIPAPAINRAMITLADGSRVYLDSAGNGQLAHLGNIKLVKLANGQIAYQTADGQILKELQYNTLTNPKGSKVIDMTLSDGSHVWLNAGSSITYPVAFIGGERKVELKGEGYFEVTHDPNKKFIVSAGDVKTEVLGTHFNVNAYSENSVTKVTLLEGSVRTGGNAGSVIIKPGQQAQVADKIKVVEADLDQVMAWRNGFFYLNNQSIGEVMREISNWYDVEVVYASGVPDVELYGKMGRELTLSQVLKILQKVGLQCKLENHKLIIN